MALTPLLLLAWTKNPPQTGNWPLRICEEVNTAAPDMSLIVTTAPLKERMLNSIDSMVAPKPGLNTISQTFPPTPVPQPCVSTNHSPHSLLPRLLGSHWPVAT